MGGVKFDVKAAKTLPSAMQPADRHELSGRRVRVRGHHGVVTHADRHRAYVRLDSDTAAWFPAAELELVG